MIKLFNKEKLSLNDLVFNFITLLTSFKIDDLNIDFKVYAQENNITVDEITQFKNNVFLFELMIFFLLLSDYVKKKNINISDEKLGYMFGYNLSKIFIVEKQNRGLTNQAIKQLVENGEGFIPKFDSELENFGNTISNGNLIPIDDVEDQLKEKGIFFFYCVYFASEIFQADLNIESERFKNFAIIHLANELYKKIRDMFNILTKEYKIIAE